MWLSSDRSFCSQHVKGQKSGGIGQRARVSLARPVLALRRRHQCGSLKDQKGAGNHSPAPGRSAFVCTPESLHLETYPYGSGRHVEVNTLSEAHLQGLQSAVGPMRPRALHDERQYQKGHPERLPFSAGSVTFHLAQDTGRPNAYYLLVVSTPHEDTCNYHISSTRERELLPICWTPVNTNRSRPSLSDSPRTAAHFQNHSALY